MTPAPALDEQQEQDPKALYGEKFENLPEQIVNALRETIKDFQQQEKYLRRREVMRDRRNRFYERGFQHITWQQGQNAGYAAMSAGLMSTSPSGQQVQTPNYIDDYNIFQPYERVLMANLTQNPPGIDFRAMNPDHSEDVDAAETAEGYRHLFDRSNSVKQIQIEITRMFSLSGRTVLWTRTEANAQRFGTNDDGSPKQMECCTVHGTLESKVPILSKCQDDALYVFLSDDIDVAWAKSLYPWKADKIKAGISGLGENAYERLARLGVLQGARSEMLSAESYLHLVTRLNGWLRPEAFTGDRYDADFDEEPGTTIGEKIKQIFPQGCHPIFIGDEYVQSSAESMDDHLIIGFPYEGDGMNRMAMLDPMVIVQDAFNDAMNAAREIFDVAWPSTWINADQEDFDTIVGQKADPYAIRQLKTVANGMKAQDMFWREPNPELPATFTEFIQNLQGELPQFILAAPPALFGAAMEDQKTASGYAQARAQALGQQGIIWAQMQVMMARMYYQAALCAADNPDHAQGVLVPGGGAGTAAIQIDKIRKGHFGAYPDEDSSFPESTSAKRATLMQLLTLLGPTPEGAEIFSIPQNQKVVLTLNGFPELVIPQAQAYDQEMFVIEQLLQQSPVPPDPMMQEQANIDHAAATIKVHQSGQPDAAVPPPPQIQPTCSIPPQDWENHQWAAQTDQMWLNSQDCRRQQAQGNDAGVQNVILRWRANMAMIPPPMPMVAPPGEPAAPGAPPQPSGGNLLPASIEAPGAPGTQTM